MPRSRNVQHWKLWSPRLARDLGSRQTHQGPLYGVASRLCTPRPGRGRRIGVLSVGPCHAGVKKALAMVSSHYVGIDLSAVSEGYVVPDDEAEA